MGIWDFARLDTPSPTESRRRLLPYLGWGLLTAWGLVGMSAAARGAQAIPPSDLLGVFTGSSGIALLVFAIIAIKRGVTGDSPRHIFLFGAGIMIACCLIAQIARADYPACWLQIIAQTGASVGYMVLMLGWIRAYRRLDVQDIETCTVLSTALCALVCLPVFFLPSLAASLCRVLLPVGSIACLSRCLNDACDSEKVAESAESQETKSHIEQQSTHCSPSHGILPCFAGVTLGSASLVVPALFVPVTNPQVAPFAPYAQLSGLALSAILVLYCTVYARRIDLASFFRALYPLTVGGLCLVAIASEVVVRVMGLCMLCAAQWVLYLFIWLYALENRQSSAEISYALLRIAFEGGFLIANGLLVVGCVFSPVSLCFVGATVFVLTILLPLDERNETPADGTACADTIAMLDDSGLLIERYGLSSREHEVLSYLRRGYSLVAIRNELFISKGTVDTYVQRIYRKFGVHSRQELITCCEKVEEAAERARSAASNKT